MDKKRAIRSKFDFFIAHSGADDALAEELARLLKEAGFLVFLDKFLLQGTRWDEAIPEAQLASRATIILISDKHPVRTYFRAEINTAINLAESDKKLHLVLPVYLGNRRDDYGLSGFQSLQLSNEGGLQNVCLKLGEAMKSRAIVRSATPQPPHALTAYRASGLVDPIHPDIIEGYAKLFLPADALFLLDRANALRQEANPDDPVIELYLLPNPEATSRLDFWVRTFHQARMHGPRMVAALLLAADPQKFAGLPEAASRQRTALLNKMRIA